MRRFNRVPNFALASIATGVLLLACLVWRPVIDVSIDSSKVRFDGGNQYSFDVSKLAPPGYRLLGDSDDYPMQSALILLRDGVPLGPPHTVTETLKRGINGNGAFSHWNGVLYFSTPENLDPRFDGHKYSLKARLSLSAGLAASLGLSIFAIAALWILRSMRSQAKLWRTVYRTASAPLKVLALTVVFATVPFAVYRQAEMLATNGKIGLLAIYLGIMLISVFGLFITPFLRSWWIRAPLSIVLLAGFVTDQIVVAIYGQHIVLDLTRTIWRERDMGSAVLTAYQDTILSNLAFGALLSAAFMLAPPARFRLGPRFSIFPICAFIFVAMALYFTNGEIEMFLPSFAVPSQMTVVQFQSMPSHMAREPVHYDGTIKPQIRKIIMVVDESVRGDYLGLNNPKYDNTPYLRQMADKMANYGTAVSTANCSGSSRVILRVGLQKDQLPDLTGSWARLPTIWQYAHRAGFRTALVDAWQKDRPFHSYMTKEEASGIDIQDYPGDEPAYLRDLAVAGTIIELLQRDEPLFIYVNKYGTHMDYSKTYPPDIEDDPSPRIMSLPLDEHRRNVVQEYHKALRWSVDRFFEKVLPEVLKRPDTILIYTSDHGQSMFEGGYDASHCSVNPGLARGELFVPLFVATHGNQLEPRFNAEAHRAFNRAHHLEIFPTLLELLGYQSQWVTTNYGPSLLNVPIDRKRAFLLGTFNLPGAQWVPVDDGKSHTASIAH